MIIIDFKECPFCNYKIRTESSGSTTNIYRTCNSCNRYTWYENLVPDRLSITQSFYDENNNYNIIVFSFHGNKEANKIVLRQGYTDKVGDVQIKDIEQLKQKLEELSIFA